MTRPSQPGDQIIYRMPKHSVHPGSRARDVRPAPHGEDYAYYVDKFWIVTAVRPNGDVVAQTRGAKRHFLRADDPALRRAAWWERFRYRNRFPSLKQATGPSHATADTM